MSDGLPDAQRASRQLARLDVRRLADELELAAERDSRSHLIDAAFELAERRGVCGRVADPGPRVVQLFACAAHGHAQVPDIALGLT
ncbi:MAG TPA: hypothetical protein VGJ91_18730, partial [Polyangiaceae bacterium]